MAYLYGPDARHSDDDSAAECCHVKESLWQLMSTCRVVRRSTAAVPSAGRSSISRLYVALTVVLRDGFTSVGVKSAHDQFSSDRNTVTAQSRPCAFPFTLTAI